MRYCTGWPQKILYCSLGDQQVLDILFPTKNKFVARNSKQLFPLQRFWGVQLQIMFLVEIFPSMPWKSGANAFKTDDSWRSDFVFPVSSGHEPTPLHFGVAQRRAGQKLAYVVRFQFLSTEGRGSRVPAPDARERQQCSLPPISSCSELICHWRNPYLPDCDLHSDFTLCGRTVQQQNLIKSQISFPY